MKKEMYNFILQNKSDSNRAEYINLKKAEIETNEQAIEMLKKEYNVKSRVCSNCVEIANGDHITWHPTNRIQH